MGIASGLAGSLGIAAESTFGTYVAPARFVEPSKIDLKKAKMTVQGGGLAAGRMVQAGTRRAVVGEGATGSIDMEVPNKGFGLILSHIFGASTIAQQGATAAWAQSHTLADNVGKSLSLQSGVPDLGGTVRPYTLKGGKVTSAEFKCAAGELLMTTIEIDGRQLSEAESLALPSLPAGLLPFNFAQMGVKIGAFGAETAVQGVKGMSLKLERPQAADRWYANNAGLKAEQLMNDNVKVSGSFSADYVDKTIFADRFASDASFSLIWEFIGPLIAGAFFQTFRLRVPMVFLDGDTPTVSGPGLVSGDFPFVGQFDLTNPAVSCDYISTDTTI